MSDDQLETLIDRLGAAAMECRTLLSELRTEARYLRTECQLAVDDVTRTVDNARLAAEDAFGATAKEYIDKSIAEHLRRATEAMDIEIKKKSVELSRLVRQLADGALEGIELLNIEMGHFRKEAGLRSLKIRTNGS